MLNMKVPDDGIHLEDVEIGRTVAFGRKVVTKEEIVAFAAAFDPQPMHLDEDFARTSIVGGLCASGFHTCAMLMRMLADEILVRATSLGSPGVDEVRWMKPVRPGDILSAEFVCTEKRELASRPGIGLAKISFLTFNQNRDVVMSWASNQLLRVRHPSASRPSGTPGSGAPSKITSFWELPRGFEPNRASNYFEDRVIGETYDLGSHTFTRDETVAFAREFDPQPLHLDDEAARRSLFGALSASGWHTAATFIRLFVAYRQKIEAEMHAKGIRAAQYGPSPGFRNLRWLKPVFPGDTLEYQGRLSGKIDWKSRPDRGLILTDTQARNQKGELVFAITGQILAERRKPAPAP